MMLSSAVRHTLFGLVLFAVPLQGLAQTPNDPRLDDAWYLDAIAAPAAWDITTGSPTVVVAVLDTGLDLDHEDIAENLWTNSNEVAGNGVDDDNNGFVDDVHGWDFIEDDNDPSPGSGNGASADAASHGTLVAGQIGAVGDNAVGFSGVNWQVKIMPVRMLDDQGGGTEHDAAANAIRYALRNGAKVINLSFAGDEAHTALQNAVKDAFTNDVVIVAALGNEARDTDLDPVYPACLRGSADDWVIGVTASDEDDRGASFTNFGRICADVAAPGTNVYGLGYENGTANHSDLYVGPWNGTSMASPLVAGAAALLFAEYPTLSAGDVRNILKLSVDPIRIDGYLTGELGAGRLNIARALALAAAYAPASDVVDVVVEDEQSDESAPASDPVPDPSIDEDSVLQYSFVAFGAPAGVEPMVKMYRAHGVEYASFAAYASNFRGGVHVTTLNYDDDLMIPEIVTGAGEGGGPHVRVFTATGSVLHQFFAYDSSSSHGVFVATGDVDGDEVEEIVTSVGSGVSSDIVAWTADGVEVLRFSADRFPASSALEVTTLDYDDDYSVEFAVTGIIDGVAHVALYDNDGTYLVDFVPYTGATSISVTGADLDGDSRDSVLVSSRMGTNDIREFTTIGALRGITTLYDQALLGNAIGAVELDMDGNNDIVAFENVDGGMVTMVSSDAVTILGSWRAPAFGGAAAPFFTVW